MLANQIINRAGCGRLSDVDKKVYQVRQVRQVLLRYGLGGGEE